MRIDLPLDKHDWHPSPLPGQVVLVTTVDEAGRPNVATKSWLSMVAFGPPPILVFGCNSEHATARNAERTGEFVVNVPPCRLAAACWAVGTDEAVRGPERFERNGLTAAPSVRVRPPRVAECRAHIECIFDGIKAWGREVAIFGRVVAASVDREVAAGEPDAQYRSLAPFFFLESGWLAEMGRVQRPGGVRPGVVSRITILAVRDLVRSERFYREAFGWPKRVDVDVYVEFEPPSGSGLGIYQAEAFAHNPRCPPAFPPAGAISGTELYFHADDLAGAVRRLEAAGARLLAPVAPKPWGDEAAYFADPDGNVIAVARPLPASAGDPLP